ncbi:ABC transporter substrate-binding protein [Cryobacterium sp. LW097]|uniref:peptide ABC transporter substrate-binding protein n=2 Tax=unclassified Cryobacterium TaxID=2649013 RepID=UPI000B4DD493|nr:MULTISPECIES: ABC transporter substrate-binding protein [unclassified Cryobacterium]ASD21536.1 ABC transporter substrate-binding protein [Cryobacterium sp. LW097]TFC69648.1 ABC transporter substrate-binding protein [Cryobacterium sp. TMB3-15]TFC56118.1 ABC transporter substrate-binding protein [Cryobacterium sp. TMB3-1-2]TFC62641.1 ABC transporter substrate-binding protein [Cryobacterium sp. TMB1-7]TFC78014.1 ABC transporter substrate-binding protein [Cryobacterium sp. TMB3-10]
MKRSRMGLSALALISVSALALSGCATSNDEEATSAGDASAVVSTNGSEPQNPLIPTNTTETGGGKIATSIFAGLVSYNADGEIENEVAKSIESDDATNWTVTLEEGWTFTNDEPVTASSFVDAWNYGALFSNAQSASYFFDDIVGFDYEVDSELTGLKVVDDTTFTVELASPEADWPLRLGYTAFMPLPSAAYDDMAAFGENPIGNGPYMLDGEGAWVHEEKISLVTNPGYEGVRKPVNGGLEIKFYSTQDAAYADVQGGNLDVLDAVPDSAFETYEAEFGERSVNQAAAIFQGFNMPYYLEHWSGEEGKLRRAAISMSINREEITDVIFQGTRTPATDFTSPVIDGYSDQLEGAEVLEYNPEEAVKLWAKADAIAPYGDSTFDIAYNSDGGHQAWVDAVINSVVNTLGISATGKPYPTFAAALEDRSNDALTGGTRAGWQGDYPSMYNFLAPLYQTGAGSNYEDYSSEEFDSLLKEGAAAETVEDATAKYQAAQEVLLKDLPSIPLWYSNVNGVWADTVSDVVFGWDSVPLYYQITKG